MSFAANKKGRMLYSLIGDCYVGELSSLMVFYTIWGRIKLSSMLIQEHFSRYSCCQWTLQTVILPTNSAMSLTCVVHGGNICVCLFNFALAASEGLAGSWLQVFFVGEMNVLVWIIIWLQVSLSSQACKVLPVTRALTLPVIALLEPSKVLAGHTVFFNVVCLLNDFSSSVMIWLSELFNIVELKFFV